MSVGKEVVDLTSAYQQSPLINYVTQENLWYADFLKDSNLNDEIRIEL